MKECHKKSLAGRLPCSGKCTLLDNSPYIPNSMFTKNKKTTADYSQLKHLIILFGQTCNLRCVMCDQDHSSKVMLDLEKIKRNVNFDYIQHVDILGGEPLLIGGVMDFFDFLIRKNIKVNFISNGTIMNDELAKKIAVNSDVFMVSLNAATKKTHEKINRGSKWEKVLENIKRLNLYKVKYKTGLVMHGHMTIVVRNLHEIHLFIENYKKFGFDRIDFGFDEKTVPKFLERYPSFKKRISKLIENSLVGKDPSNVVSHRLKVLGLI